jgi:signal transduction histidine kinase
MTTTLRARIVDATAVGVSAVVAFLLAGDAEQSGRLADGALFWALMLGFVGCVALLWRRRHPVGVALLLAVLAVVTEFGYAAVLVAVYTVATRRRAAVAAGIAALSLVAHVPYSVVRPDPDLSAVGATVFNAVVLLVVLLVGWLVRARRQRAAALREAAVRAEDEAAAQADRLRALERGRIAREMHDVLAHRISLVSLHAGALEIRPDLSAEEIARSAAAIRASAHQALEDLREILGVLRAGADEAGLRPQPGLADLAELLGEARAAGAAVVVEDRLEGAEPPPLVGRTAYRIVQEGLTNARKHAPGAAVRVCLDRTADGELHVWLRNPLAGPLSGSAGPAIPGARTGLIGLAERVSLAGGRLEHGVRRDPGGVPIFHLEAWLPWPS